MRSLFLLFILGCGAHPSTSLAQMATLPSQPDLIVYGATPGGIVTAVRAAREGLNVVLVHHHLHLGGMMSNNIGLVDTIYDGRRAPLYDEVIDRIAAHYQATYGEGSPNHRASLWPPRGSSGRPRFEPHVAEKVFENMISAEKNIVVLREFYPVSITRDGRMITSVTFRRMKGKEDRTLAAAAFADASYEGDLAAVAGAEMTWGRESRDKYGEPHAGRVFTKARFATDPEKYFPSAIRTEGLNLRGFRATTGPLLPGSTGEGDRAIQAYNFRMCLTTDPDNRIPVEKPARYERDLYMKLRDRWGLGGTQQNRKSSWNVPLLIEGNFDYPNGDWETRHAIAARHRDFATGLLWFLQHDPEVPDLLRASALERGLPRDEFTDNGGVPWEMYVREARRLVGRYVFTEHDAVAVPGLTRAPFNPDSIAITEWPLDSHSCHWDTVPGSDHEGKLILTEETRPGQIPYRCLLPREFDNLLVTVCLSSSHVGWGTIRLEPVWMHVGESAGHAFALSKIQGIAPAGLAPAALQRLLVERSVMISFFNDFDMFSPTPEQRAAQFFGPRGFFSTYDARLAAPLTRSVAKIWAQSDGHPLTTARRVATATGEDSITAAEFAQLSGHAWPNAPAGPLSRGAACAWLYSQSVSQ
ncbi:MAG: protein-xanthan lyase [Rariglobus sp.]|jgi:hypothetical protein|nr:protein-xanthan lyase [Rariglobus sp.]